MKEIIYNWVIITLILLPMMAQTQNIQGYVKDGKNGEPLTGVNVFIAGTTIGTTTNNSGFYKLPIIELPIVLTISYLGYETRKISLTKLPPTPLTIELFSVASLLPEAIVRATPKIDTIYKAPYSVIDYEFFDTYIMVLVYRGVRKRYSVLLLDADGTELSEVPLEQKVPVGFYKGCLGAVYFLTADEARQIYIENKTIHFYKSVDLKLFEQLLYPCVLSANDYIYFQNYYVRGQAVHYYRIHKDSTNGTRESFSLIIDEKRVTMAETEGQFQKMVQNMEEFSTRPIGIGELLNNSSFVDRVVFEPIYAPLFPLQDTLLVFNHRFNQIEFYDLPKTIFKTVAIDYSKDKKWKSEIIRDEDTQQFYTLFDTRWGYLVKQIDVQTGKTIDMIELDRAFVTNIKVKSGFLYFLQNNFRNNDCISKLQKVRIN